jgi:hypothetical protein
VWGDAKRLLLTNDNEEWLSTPGVLSVATTGVPRTFNDAFVVAENLSIQYLWIDALCICQDDVDELRIHMDAMETVYSSAMLTIVSDTSSADTGIFGVSVPRGPPQATFTWAGTTYIGARKTFGEALKSSLWESRAWCVIPFSTYTVLFELIFIRCLQEKVFSKRLLIFTESQVFYHCAAATWFEDTVMEQKANISGAIHMRERRHPRKKGLYGAGVDVNYTAYESHREHFGRNFWALVKAYSKRQLSFESDVIRAFTGILTSIEPDFGTSLWGIPSGEFVRGLTWALSTHRVDLRRRDFPSWSWTGWRSNDGVELQFKNCKRTDADIQVSRGRYRVDLNAHNSIGPSVWTLDWYYYPTELESDVQLVHESRKEDNVTAKKVNSILEKNEDLPDDSPEQEVIASGRSEMILNSHCWRLPGHPRAKDESETMQATYASSSRWFWDVPLSELSQVNLLKPKVSNLTLPPLNHKPGIMPPLSHIIRFYTSVATVFIPADPDPDLERSYIYSSNVFEESRPLHKVCLPDSEEHIAVVNLDPAWQGKGQLHTIVYISRWCRSFAGEERKATTEYSNGDERLHTLLIEDVDGWGEVKRRVQLLDVINLKDWRKAKPRWELVSLA